MKKKLVHRTGRTTVKRQPKKKGLLFLIKSWMFVVMFALMLGIGAIVGTYLNQQMNASNPEVAGVSIEAK